MARSILQFLCQFFRHKEAESLSFELEPLEGRVLMSAVAPTATFSEGVLVIEGTPRKDEIGVASRNLQGVGGEEILLVTIQSGRGRFSEVTQIPFRPGELKLIRIVSGSGNDRVSGYLQGLDAGISVDTGSGKDKIDFLVFNFLGQHQFDVVSGPGNDRINLEVWGDPQQVIGYNPSANGGDGNDRINIVTSSRVAASGGAGNDQIDLRGPDTVVSHHLSGDGGNDQIRTGSSSDIYGGTGRNRLTSTSPQGSYFRGTGGRDTMTGRSGNNIFSLHGGRYRIVAGQGDDDVHVYESLESLQLDGGKGFDRLAVWQGSQFGKIRLKGVEIIGKYSFTKG